MGQGLVVLGELEFGAEKSAHPGKNRARLATLIEDIPISPLNDETSRQYGRIRAQLERTGTPIGSNDYWIAAQALALGAVAVTDNVDEVITKNKYPTWLVFLSIHCVVKMVT